MGVPRYVVLSDSTLQAIASARPQNRDDLTKIKGVGPRTLAKFGDDVLSLMRESLAPTACNKYLKKWGH
jgi:DNA helicase-2/ATP-dependent DNA helicase PcrA